MMSAGIKSSWSKLVASQIASGQSLTGTRNGLHTLRMIFVSLAQITVKKSIQLNTYVIIWNLDWRIWLAASCP